MERTLLRFIGLLGLILAGAIWIAGCVVPSSGRQARDIPVDKRIEPDDSKPGAGTAPVWRAEDAIPEMVPCAQLDDDAGRWVRQAANCMTKRRP